MSVSICACVDVCVLMSHTAVCCSASWKLMDPGESGGSETEPPVSQAFKLFLQETSSFKQQNPGKVRTSGSKHISMV